MTHIEKEHALHKEELANVDCEIIKVVEDVIGMEIDEEFNLPESNIDSIIFIKMVLELENKFEFQFDDEMLYITNFPTVKQLAEYVKSKMEQDY